jgi:hypothetical protein
MGVGDAPVAGLQLHRLTAIIGDRYRVGPEEIIVLGRRPVGDKARGHHDLDIAGHSPIHDTVPDTVSGIVVVSPALAALSVQSSIWMQ